MTGDNITTDRSARPLAVAGLLVGAVALLGVDLTNPTATTRLHKAPSSIVHAVAPATSAAIVIAPAFAGSVIVLILLLWLGSRSADSPLNLTRHDGLSSASQKPIPPLVQARHSISYHTGGLYGP